jgi:hypothetical protein
VWKLIFKYRNSSPTPSLAKRRGYLALSLKVPLFLREGFRVSSFIVFEYLKSF